MDPRGPTDPAPRRSYRWLWLLVAGLPGLAFVSPLFGPTAIPAGVVLQVLGHELTGGLLFPNPCAGASLPDSCSTYFVIVWQIRVPAVLLAIGVGAALGISGGTLQGLFRNPLADPFLLGISSGGTLGAVIVFVFFIGSPQVTAALPLFAFAGALATGLVMLAVARSRVGSVETLLLAGVGLSSLLSSIVAFLLIYNRQASTQITDWLLGSVAGGTWPEVGITFLVLLAVSFLLLLHSRELNLIQLGNDVAQSVGVDPSRVRVRLILLASLATATAVAFAGIIGFVGLVAPHVIRRLVAVDYRAVLAGSLVVGAVFLLAAWDIDLFFAELPIGIFTAFVGVPFFLAILFRRSERSTMGGG